jgi:hypothetical protein
MSAFSWRCQYCSWAFQMSSEAVVAALAAADATQARHYVEQCPRCRKALKIPVDQLRHHAPMNVPAATSAPIRPTSFKEDEKKMSDLPAPIPPVEPLIPIPPPAAPVAVPAPAAPAPAPKPVVRKPAKKVVKKAVKKAAKKVVKKKAAKKVAKKSVKKAAKKVVKKAAKKKARK